MRNLEVPLKDLGIILAFGSSAGGKLVGGPATSTNNAIPTWNGTAGNALNNSDLLYSSQTLSIGTTNGNFNLAANGTGAIIGARNFSMPGASTGNGNFGSAITGLTGGTNYVSMGYDTGTGCGYLRCEQSGVGWTAMRYTGQSHAIYVGGTTLAATIDSNAALLLGTGTNSANGRIQLATHTTSAGGIGFGTDTSFFRVNAGELHQTSTGTGSTLFFDTSGSVRSCFIGNASGIFQVGTLGGGAYQIYTSNVLAIVVDTSQNATFAGTIIAPASTTAKSSMTITTGTAPTSPADGNFWYDGTNLKFRNSGTTRTITWV